MTFCLFYATVIEEYLRIEPLEWGLLAFFIFCCECPYAIVRFDASMSE